MHLFIDHSVWVSSVYFTFSFICFDLCVLHGFISFILELLLHGLCCYIVMLIWIGDVELWTNPTTPHIVQGWLD